MPSEAEKAGPAGPSSRREFAARLRAVNDRLSSSFHLGEDPGRAVLWPLLLVSFASLYIEVMLIRWMGTEVGVFAFFQNLALIACFLGFGLGCYKATQKKRFLFDMVALGLLVVMVDLPFAPARKFLENVSNGLSLSPDSNFWGNAWIGVSRSGAVAIFWVSLLLVTAFLMLIIGTMIPLGQWVGYYLDRAPNPVSAYSVNLLGSLLGIWVFAGLAFLWAPPVWWFGLAILLFVLVRPRSWRLGWTTALLIIASLVVLVLAPAGELETVWSPYQKLTIERPNDLGYQINVNNSAYMSIADLSPTVLARHPDLGGYMQRSSYDAPFRFVGHCDHVLIVGAGAGNDAAAALRHCPGSIDAVEIDPAIYSVGRQFHPQRPYSSPRVHMILNDARAFLRTTHQKYDVILFGLLDSFTNYSNFSNMRIDNYVYTEQAFQEARRLLTPHGVLVLKFEVRAPWTWMGDRFYSTLAQVFGRPPVVFYRPRYGALFGATVFVASNDPGLWQRAAEPPLAALVAQNPPPFSLGDPDPPPPATDDWPYVYHPGRWIPRAYLAVSLVLLGLALLLVRRSFQPRRLSTWLFFFLGAGFLLLETQMVSRLALYFGTTWMVNCIALSAILGVLVAANLYVERFHPSRLGIYLLLLIASLAAIYVLPWENLPFGAHTTGLLLSAAYSLPLFMAGVIFTEIFRRSECRSSAFAANIFGAVAGGLAQNFSFIFGMNALLLIAAAFYFTAGFCLRASPMGEAAAAETLSAD
jgi:spermidine synthase